MDRKHLQPNPPRGQQTPGNRSPRPQPSLTSPLRHPHSTVTTPRGSTSAPRPPSHARPSLASVPDVTGADWAAPTHSRSPVPVASSATARAVTSAAAPASAGRVYRGETGRASTHGLHTNHAVPLYLGVLSPPAEDDVNNRGSASRGTPQFAMGSLNESLTHHYTHPRTEQGLFTSSTSSSTNHNNNTNSDPASPADGMESEAAILESPTEVVQYMPVSSGVVASSGEGSFGFLSTSAGDGLQDDLDEFFSVFINRLPLAWSRPLLRALTLQVATENVPARVLTVAALFDLYDDIKGELLGQLRVAQKEATMAAAAGTSGTQYSLGNVDPDTTVDLLSSTQTPSAALQRSGGGGGGARASTSSRGPLHSPESIGLAEELAPAPPTLDLYRMYSVAPSILRYRFNSLREAMYTDMQSQYEVAVRRQEEQEARGAVIAEESRIAMPSRQEIVNCLARPHPKDDVLFGAHLVQGAPRHMRVGALLFHATGEDGPLCSRNGTPPNHHSQHRRGLSDDGGDTTDGQDSAALADGEPAPAFSSVSYESMPSIFLKGAVDLQLQMNRHQISSLQSLSRGAMRPRHAFFTREFLATVACGGDAACLFATTFTPEFLVGLSAFIDHPYRAVRSAIRATLHRLNVLLATELVRVVNPPAAVRERIRAPPLDLAVLYLRENDLYFASTGGLESKLFFITNSLGSERLVLDLDDEYTAASIMGAAGRHHLGDGASGGFGEGSLSMASSYSSMSGLASATTFDMPTLTRSQVDLSFLCTQVVSGPRHGGEGASSATVALFYHSCRGGLSRTTIPMIPGDYHRARRSRHHEGQTTTEPLLPLVALTASSEFWRVMPSHMASDLLRVLVLLNEEAMLFPHGGLAALQAERHLRGTSAWTSEMESEYVARDVRLEHVLNYVRTDLAEVFESDVRERLCEYFRHRVEHFRELDTRNAQTMPEKLREKLEQAAAARAAHQQNGTSDGSLHSTVPGMTDSNAGGHVGEGMHAQRVCDAIAAALVAEAVALAKQAADDMARTGTARPGDFDFDDDDDDDDSGRGNSHSATRILLGDVNAGSLGELTGSYSAPRRAGSRGAGGARGSSSGVRAPRQRTLPAGPSRDHTNHADHAECFTVSVLIIPSAPISTRSTTRRR